jgi:hypothetical protein
LPFYDLSKRIGQYRLEAELELIETPVLVCPTGPEPLWVGQSEDLCGRLPGFA